MNKKSIIKVPAKILIVLFIIIIVIFISIILLLSIFFPSELVRQQIEKQGSEYIGTEVKLRGLKFNIFRGLELSGLTVRQYGLGWKEKYIVSLESARLKYRVIPLLNKVVSVKELVVEDGALNLERNWRGANWEYFLNKFQGGNQKGAFLMPKPIKFVSKNKGNSFSSDQIPLEINMNKLGVDGLNINYRDSLFLGIPAAVEINDLKLMAKNISIKKNNPLKISAGIKIGVLADKYIDLGAEIKANGELKLFDDETKEILVTGPIVFKLNKGNFSSNKIKEVVVSFIEMFLGEVLGPTISTALQDPTMISNTAGKYFDNVLKESETTINKTIKDAEAVLAKKDEVLKYSDKLTTDFDLSVNKAVKDIDSKIDLIDKKISPLINVAARIPMIESLVNLNHYRNKVKDIKKEAKKRKSSITKTYRSKLQNELKKKIDSNFPKEIPGYDDFKNKFDSQVTRYKKEINKNIQKLSIDSFVKNFLPDLSFMDKAWEIYSLSTTYEIGKKESNAKEFNLSTEYFDLKGDMLIKGKYIDFNGEMSSGVKDFNFGFLSQDKISSKVSVKGELPNISVKLNEKPQFEIDPEKQKDMAITVVENYIKNNYGSNKIISNIMKGFSVKDIDIENLKNMMSKDKNTQLNAFNNEKKKLNSYIQKNIDKVLKELKSKVPGL